MSSLRNPADALVARRALTLMNTADGAEGLVLADLARALAVRPDAPPVPLLAVL